MTTKFKDSDEAIDSLPPDEYDGDDKITIHKKVRILEAEISRASVAEQPKLQTWRKVINWIKIAVLCLAWLIYTIGILTKEEYTEYDMIFSFGSKTMVKNMGLQKQLKDKVLIGFMGPFITGAELMSTIDENEPYLSFHMELVNGNLVEVLTKKFYLKLDNSKRFEDTKLVKKYIELKLEPPASKGNGIVRMSLNTNVDKTLTLKLLFNLDPLDERLGIPLGAMVLLFLYIHIIWELVDRTFATVAASTLAIGILAALDERPTFDLVTSWVDVETLMLLFGMMILVSILSESGIFDYLAVLAYELSKGNLFGLIYCLCMFTASFSAFLDNVTMMLLVAPVTIRLCEVCNLNPVPVIMSMVIFSNIGAALTPVGDPPNILIMTNHYINTHGVNFGNFCLHMIIPVLMCIISTFIHLRITYPKITDFMNKQSAEIQAVKHEIQVWEKAAQAIAPYTTDEEIIQNTLHKKAASLKVKLKELESKGGNVATDYQSTLLFMKDTYSIRNKSLLIKALIAFCFVLVIFCLHAVHNIQYLSLGWTALVGAILLLILADDVDIETVLSRVEWSTLLFFACLFTLMEALTELGLIDVLGNFCIDVIAKAEPQQRLLVAILLILWVSGIASAFLANIPVTTMMVKIIIKLAQSEDLNLPLTPLVWALALGACFGGNGTLIGASANVVSSGVAEQHGYRISFRAFFQFGFPIMLNTLVMASLYLFVAHCVLKWH